MESSRLIATLSRSGSNNFALANFRSYDVWGSVRQQNSVDSDGGPKQKYCANLGHVQDDESDLIYMRARYYEPGVGRFLSEDPAMDGKNWFAYCSNNPVIAVDFSGNADELDQRTWLAVEYGILATELAILVYNASTNLAARVQAVSYLTFLALWVGGEFTVGLHIYHNSYLYQRMIAGAVIVSGIAALNVWMIAGTFLPGKSASAIENYIVLLITFVTVESIIAGVGP